MKELKSEDPTGLVEGKVRNDEKLEIGRGSGQSRYKRSSSLSEMMKDGQLRDSESNGGSASLTEHALETKVSKQKVQNGHLTKTKCISVLVGQGTEDKQSPGSGNAKHENEKSQRLSRSKKKKDLNLPRRASKRLAGIEVDTVPELKASTRARRVGSKQSDNLAGCSSQQPYVQEERDNTEEKPGVLPDSPLADFFSDPCIAFAIKTLKDHSEDGETDDMSYIKQECNVLPPPGNLVKQEKHDGIVGSGEKSGSSITEPPFGSSWPDPCIEFAIKTLTGAIPLEYDPHIEEYFQKQLRSSQQHKDNVMQKEIA
ncbi:uncharacterized protein LOC126802683 isoform X2 [Argentina anserina]|uniref:uncharacterized protein LOC126802683 isoform X2 n=1 Tax=Argentina anserina TaxID=57926 RepID=UPI0021767297|nr:uncharacterized protein LOC126802683 isoform X2 [Potentilla anserina]